MEVPVMTARQRLPNSAVVASIVLQYGIPLNVIGRALLRDIRGVASSSLGCALDIIAAEAAP
jgi:hypothetical protein